MYEQEFNNLQPTNFQLNFVHLKKVVKRFYETGSWVVSGLHKNLNLNVNSFNRNIVDRFVVVKIISYTWVEYPWTTWIEITGSWNTAAEIRTSFLDWRITSYRYSHIFTFKFLRYSLGSNGAGVKKILKWILYWRSVL